MSANQRESGEAGREAKELELVRLLNAATKTSQGFFLYHLSQYGVGAGKIRDLIMKLDNEDFDLFYRDEVENLKCGTVAP